MLGTVIQSRGPGALGTLLRTYGEVKGINLSQISHAASRAYDLRTRRVASLLLNPNQPNRLKTFLQLVPKAILHVHLDGSVKPQTVFELAQARGIDLRKDQPRLPKRYSVSDLERFMRIQPGRREKDFWDFLLKAFGLPLAVMQDEKGIERIAEELMEQAYEDGALHVEVRFAPCVHLRGGLSYEAVIESVIRGLARGSSKFGVSFVATPAIYRDKIDPRFGDEYRDSPALTTQATINVYKNHQGRVPLAFDLVGFETPYPPELFKEYFDKVFQLGIPITVHAGEMLGTERNILTAIRELHAQRIGHGIHLLKLSQLERNEVRLTFFEVCPTMNIQTACIEGENIKDHPILDIFNRGFRVTLSPDNITISGVTVSDELLNLNRIFGFPLFAERRLSPSLLNLMSRSIEAAFVSDSRKKELRQDFAEYYKLLNQLLEFISLSK